MRVKSLKPVAAKSKQRAALEQMFQHAREARVQWAQRFAQGV